MEKRGLTHLTLAMQAIYVLLAERGKEGMKNLKRGFRAKEKNCYCFTIDESRKKEGKLFIFRTLAGPHRSQRRVS